MKAEMRMEESEDGWTGTGKVSMEYDGDGHMAWFRLVLKKIFWAAGARNPLSRLYFCIFSLKMRSFCSTVTWMDGFFS